MVAIFAIIKLTYATILLLYQRDSIMTQFDQALTASVDNLIERFSERVPVITDAELAAARDAIEGPLSKWDADIAIYYNDGSLLAASNRSGADIEPTLVERALATPYSIHASVDDEADTRRVAAKQFSAGEGQLFILAIAADDRNAARTLTVVSRVILVMTPFGIMAAAVSGWFIAGIAIRPIEEVRRVAAGWSPESMGKEVEMHPRDSEVTRLQHELEDARRRIEAGFEAQARFMSNVSHEFCTPISTVLTEAQVLDLRDTPEDVRDFVRSTEAEMSKLGRLVESFLTLTRVRHGRSETIAKHCLVNELVMESVEHCAPMAQEYGVSLVPHLLEGEDHLDTRVDGDPDLLRTMLDNLVRNAVRFSPKHATVTIRAEIEGDDACIRVRDEGPGIPDEILQAVFNRFAQAKREHKRGRGHGLGLEIAQGIAELHGGDISVRNPADGGCEFTICLPVRTRSAVPSTEPAGA